MGKRRGPGGGGDVVSRSCGEGFSFVQTQGRGRVRGQKWGGGRGMEGGHGGQSIGLEMGEQGQPGAVNKGRGTWEAEVHCDIQAAHIHPQL